jgi:hypothetical protein
VILLGIPEAAEKKLTKPKEFIPRNNINRRKPVELYNIEM